MKLFSCVMVCSTTCDSKQRYGGRGLKKRKRFGSGRVINPEHDSTQASFGFLTPSLLSRLSLFSAIFPTCIAPSRRIPSRFYTLISENYNYNGDF